VWVVVSKVNTWYHHLTVWVSDEDSIVDERFYQGRGRASRSYDTEEEKQVTTAQERMTKQVGAMWTIVRIEHADTAPERRDPQELDTDLIWSNK
jgi:hypothetical protein